LGKREALLKSIYERRKGAVERGSPAAGTYLTSAWASSTIFSEKERARFMPYIIVLNRESGIG
jgi:hypothetical protein